MLIRIWWILLLTGRASFGELPHCAKESAADGEKKPEDVLVREAGMKLEVRFSVGELISVLILLVSLINNPWAILRHAKEN
ncbi:hypothetical protein ABFS83_03G000800 [Erythranthe nasuta]